ncbi:PIN domain-containing protein [Acetatifactor aquisgranensis]|uniref:PIN domain-containing protein n=1 Tax=Acetatifactor aquisgranensis TaxID=2941233 RepID=UPI002040EC30|nr:PIN domain-containing protein [Acetatifactor aquisgranensis]
MKILVDTNVIIDALTGREPFRETAEQIFMLAANQTEDMHITASSATDIYYLIRKHLHSTDKAKHAMEKLYELFYILDVTAEDCKDALSSEVKDYEDAVISCCALHNKMDYIVTRNVKDFEQSKIKAVLPDDFMKLIMNDEE